MATQVEGSGLEALQVGAGTIVDNPGVADDVIVVLLPYVGCSAGKVGTLRFAACKWS